MAQYLVTGGSGFFGSILKRTLLELGHECVNIDLQPDPDGHPLLTSILGDIRDLKLLEHLFSTHQISAVFHCAAILAHGSKIDEHLLWTSNVDGTRNIAEYCRRFGVRKLVFTSTNCLWAKNLHKPVKEDEIPSPVEIYGRSKHEAEKVLAEFSRDLDVVVLRCPTIIDTGRLGLLSILFEFIQDNNKVWVVGSGNNCYQFIYAADLVNACIRAVQHFSGSDLFHIGSENVKSLREVFSYVIEHSGSKSRIASLPKGPAIAAMKVAYALKVSPLGPYHYKMIAEDFIFDTAKIRSKLKWQPTMTNEQMLARAYDYYTANKLEILSRSNASAHRKATPMGAIRLLKWLS